MASQLPKPQGRNKLSLISTLCVLAVATTGQAQAAPDAGTLLQQIEKELKPTLPGRATPLKPEEPAPMKPQQGTTLTVKSFHFAGNTLLTDEQLRPAVQGWLNRTLSFNELQEAAQAVAKTYRAAGWIVRAYLPAQDVTDGIVTIQIVEALFSGARVDDKTQSRASPATVLARISAQQKVGQPLNAEALDRALLLADDLPGVTVAGTLEPGANNGETGILLNLRDEPLISGDLGIDNTGARTTGAPRATLTANLNSPLRLGDLMRADLITSSGNDYYRLGYSLPIGGDGWRVGINASQLDYRVVAPDFAALNSYGNSSSAGIDINYPLLRSRLKNVYLSLAYDDKNFRNYANNTTQSNYAVTAWTLGVTGNLYDNLGGGGANSFSLSWIEGHVAQGQLNIAENAALAGHFSKARYSASRQQVLTTELSFYGALSGQYARKDLDSSERFYLGGPNGVRAYPVSEGSGSSGQLTNLELRWLLQPALSLNAFYDWGHVTNYLAGASYSLKGYGLSLGWLAPYGLNLKATWATRDGNNPNPTATGKDQDGSLDRDRFWLTLNLPFDFSPPARNTSP